MYTQYISAVYSQLAQFYRQKKYLNFVQKSVLKYAKISSTKRESNGERQRKWNRRWRRRRRWKVEGREVAKHRPAALVCSR